MNEDEIAEGLQSGSPEAFRELYRAHGQPVFSYLTRLTGRREMAEELTQEAFLTTIRKISFFRSRTDGGLRAWVFRIATHLAIDVLRREKRIVVSDPFEERTDTPSVEPSAQEQLEKFEFSAELQKALQGLTEAQRMIFLLKEQEEMTSMEISRVCGCSENAVKQTLFRARASLRKKLCN